MATNLKSLEVAEEKANQREVSFQATERKTDIAEPKNQNVIKLSHILIETFVVGQLQGADQDSDGQAEASRGKG